ncbi:hypothetical protein C1645_823334 [Glomus cerebriforme]|uniref:Uncharacterized protein n=1 Tax=Glomus cerebriforme TaxID=658196 RepID=A0A397SXV9_9GLOM|nr:hypothetical protein C1645_823334 [Glomus cerebriforme]
MTMKKTINVLKKQIKTELKNQLGKFDITQITLRASGKHEILYAEILIDEGFATSYNEPVVVKTENYQEMKSFCIQCYDNEGVPLNKFEQFTMHNEDFRGLLKRMEARGLKNIDDDNEEPEIITSHIQTNKYYQISVSYLTAQKIQVPAKDFPNRVMNDEEKLEMLVEQLKDFPKKLKVMKDVEFKQLSNMEYIGVACAMLFLIELRQNLISHQYKFKALYARNALKKLCRISKASTLQTCYALRMHQKSRKMCPTALTNDDMEIPLDSVQKKCTRESFTEKSLSKKAKETSISSALKKLIKKLITDIS